MYRKWLSYRLLGRQNHRSSFCYFSSSMSFVSLRIDRILQQGKPFLVPMVHHSKDILQIAQEFGNTLGYFVSTVFAYFAVQNFSELLHGVFEPEVIVFFVLEYLFVTNLWNVMAHCGYNLPLFQFVEVYLPFMGTPNRHEQHHYHGDANLAIFTTIFDFFGGSLVWTDEQAHQWRREKEQKEVWRRDELLGELDPRIKMTK